MDYAGRDFGCPIEIGTIDSNGGYRPRRATDIGEPSPSDLSIPSDGQLPNLPITDAVSEGAPVARTPPIVPEIPMYEPSKIGRNGESLHTV